MNKTLKIVILLLTAITFTGQVAFAGTNFSMHEKNHQTQSKMPCHDDASADQDAYHTFMHVECDHCKTTSHCGQQSPSFPLSYFSCFPVDTPSQESASADSFRYSSYTHTSLFRPPIFI